MAEIEEKSESETQKDGEVDPIEQLKKNYETQIDELKKSIEKKDKTIDTYSKIISTMPVKEKEKEQTSDEIIKSIFKEI